MKFKIISFNEIIIRIYKTALYLAVEKENLEIIKVLLANDKIGINAPNILYQIIHGI